MILVNNVKLSLDTDFGDLLSEIRKHPKFKGIKIESAKLFRKSVDARKKNDVHFCCSVIITVSLNEEAALKKLKDAKPYKEAAYDFKLCISKPAHRPVIVGFGPAGMFAAYVLARAGLKPIVLERGKDVEDRTRAVAAFWNGAQLNPETNVQFGEGGAGAFSDGKLTTGIKDTRIRTILELLHHFGADTNILTDAKPHIGTDVLTTVIKNLREEVIRLGGDVRFSNRMDKVNYENSKIVSIDVTGTKKNYTLECSHLILAIGHSARDSFEMLRDAGVEMVRKPFAVGMRIEHSQKKLNKYLYGDFAEHPALGPADYKLSVHLPSGRGVYTFCMCPGGMVVNASSEEGHLAVNGMSYSARDGENANSAILTEVRPEDLEGEDVLEGIRLQRDIESKAYALTGGRGVPVQTVDDYLYGNNHDADVVSTVKPYPVFTDVAEIFPDFVNIALKEGIPLLSKKICGFDGGSVLVAPETRSSSPVRILRNDMLCSVSVEGLYPCGEGAGYAGGIMSAAVDGMKCAEAVIQDINK